VIGAYNWLCCAIIYLNARFVVLLIVLLIVLLLLLWMGRGRTCMLMVGLMVEPMVYSRVGGRL